MRVRLSILAVTAVALAVAIPAQAHAARMAGVVVARQHGALVVTGARGAGTTVRMAHSHARAGDRVEVRGRRLDDGTFRATTAAVRSHTQRALVRGVVLRHRAHTTFLAVGRSVIVLHRAPAVART